MSILTSSPRRAHNLDSFLRAALPAKISELRFENVRGNVPTRVRKLLQGEMDGLIVAKAALDRLLAAPQSEFTAVQKELREALSHCRWMVLPLRENPSAPAQGALAVEISRRRQDMRELLSPLNCGDTFRAVITEREILRSYGGGCHQKIGASVLHRPYGEMTFLRGVTDDGRVLEQTAFKSKSAVMKAAQSEVWPLNSSDVDWFAREPIPVNPPDGSQAFWVAKADAVPQEWKIEKDRLVWASGVQTWKKLARRGVWVNGCAESLGEQESPRIEPLTGGPVSWLKLTHESGYTGGEMPVLATYRLRPKADELDLSGKKYFFWKSGSSFEYAFSKNPGLKEMAHFCGPGNTQKILARHGIEPHVFLDHSQWLKQILSEPGAIATGL
jgi:hydroxymethylbilane synthase